MKIITSKQKIAVVLSFAMCLCARFVSVARAQDSSQTAWDESSKQTKEVLGMALSGTSGERVGSKGLVNAASFSAKPNHWGLHHQGRHDSNEISLIEDPGALGHLINVVTSPIGAAKSHVNAIAEAKGFLQTAASVAVIALYPFTLLASIGMNAVGGLDDVFSGVGVWLKG